MSISRTIRWILFAAVVAGAGYYGWQRFYGPEAGPKSAEAQKAGPRTAPVGRVTASPVEKADFPVYLSGPRTVPGVNTVQVRTRGDGRSDTIAVQERAVVH